MAIDNQMLIGAGCLGVIALVVAMHGKEGDPDVEMEETHEDAPSNEEVDLRLDNVYSLRNRFDVANKGALTTEQLNAFDQELNVLDRLAQSVFQRRKPFPFFNDDEKKKEFDKQVAQVFSDIAARRTQIRKEERTVVKEKVPDNAGLPKKTNKPPDGGLFDQEGGGEWPPISQSFGQSDEQSQLIEDFAAPKTGVNATSDKRDSAFQEAGDPLNDVDNQNEGGAKRSAQDDEDGLAVKSAPDQVIPSEPAKKTKLTDDPKADFQSVPDPPESKPPAKPVKPEPPVAAPKEVLDKFPQQAANAAFNQTGELLNLGPAIDDAEQQDNLDDAREAEEDPTAQAELDRKKQQVEGDDLDSASMIKFRGILSTYNEAIQKLLTKASRGALTQRDLDTIKQYVTYIRLTKPEGDAQIRLKVDTLQIAERVLVKAISLVQPRPVREGGRSELAGYGSPSKKRKTGRKRRRIMGSRTRTV